MKKRGFTMVELMIVIAVISVLATIIIPKFSQSRDRAKLSACKVNLKHIGFAMQMYANDNQGCFPAAETLQKMRSAGGVGAILSDLGYLPATSPSCPARDVSETKYHWLCPAPYNTYMVCCRWGVHAPLGIDLGYPQFSPGSGVVER